MKKIILLFIGLTIISCSSDDDTNRTTDPLIGTWNWEGQYDEEIFSPGWRYPIFKADGSVTWCCYELENESERTWRNNGSDFNKLTQNYTFILLDSGREKTENITFSADFNTKRRCFIPELNGIEQDVVCWNFIRQ